MTTPFFGSKARFYGAQALLAAAGVGATAIAARRFMKQADMNDYLTKFVPTETNEYLEDILLDVQGLAYYYKRISGHNIDIHDHDDKVAYVCMLCLHVSDEKFEALRAFGGVTFVRGNYTDPETTVYEAHHSIGIPPVEFEFLSAFRNVDVTTTRFETLPANVQRDIQDMPPGPTAVFARFKNILVIQGITVNLVYPKWDVTMSAPSKWGTKAPFVMTQEKAEKLALGAYHLTKMHGLVGRSK